MSLTNIEYGSLASSDTMNQNFNYLDKKIEENYDSTMTSLSSILSNIATINTRLSELSSTVSDNNSSLSSKLDEYKNKTKALVQKGTMVPHWNSCRSIAINNNYTATANGFVIIIPEANSNGSLKINTTTLEVSNKEIITLPIKNGDVVTSNISIKQAFFLPITEITVENF